VRTGEADEAYRYQLSLRIAASDPQQFLDRLTDVSALR